MKNVSRPVPSLRQARAVLVCGILWPATAMPQGLPFATTFSDDYFLITTSGNSIDASSPTASIEISGFEIGANKAPTPSTGDFLAGGSSGGPTLLGSTPDLPFGVLPVFQGIAFDANIAVTNAQDRFKADNVGIYADPSIGIRLAGTPLTNANESGSSFFNDPNQFPNTFVPTGPTGVLANQGGTGTFVNVDQADPLTSVAPDRNTGITFGVDFTALKTELAAARSAIAQLAPTAVLDLSTGNAGQFDVLSTLTPTVGNAAATLTQVATTETSTYSTSTDSRDFTITLTDGLNVIDLRTLDNDASLNNSNLIIDGSANSAAIFRIGANNFNVSGSNLLLGDGGIEAGDVLFVSDQPGNSTQFSLENSVVSGVSFWVLGDGGGGIQASQVQGASQFIADRIQLSDVRLTRAAFSPTLAFATGIAGDLNGSGAVDQNDLDLVLNNWGSASPAGLFNTTGLTPTIDQDELDGVLNNWGVAGAPSFALNPSVALPEPAVVALALGGLTLMVRRRRVA